MSILFNYLLLLFNYLLGICDNNIIYLIIMIITVCVMVKITTKIIRFITSIAFLAFLLIKIGLMLNYINVDTIASLIK